MRTTPRITLSLAEYIHMVFALAAIVIQVLWTATTKSPWRLFGSADDKRNYLRAVALKLIQSSEDWFSIRITQFLMPSTRTMIAYWGRTRRTTIYQDNVAIPGDAPSPVLHWIGSKPGAETSRKVMLYVHGGGFVLPISEGHISLANKLLVEAKRMNNVPIHLAIAEYSIAPYRQYPTQANQCLAILHHLHSKYGFDSSDIVLAGDSCGAAICLSVVSQILHPSPTILSPPFSKVAMKPFAGLFLISPWTSLATTALSYTTNAKIDTISPKIIRRFRECYIAQSELLPSATVSPFEIAGVTGRQYRSSKDPPIIGLERGVGITRPIGSIQRDAESDDWWKDLFRVVRRVVVSVGEYECFRDDILAFGDEVRRSCEGDASMDLEIIRDESFHAVLISDFAFGAPPSTLAARLSGWLAETFQAQPV
ncbi:SubName: Full=Related to triacylglycerol lipase 2 {ECO:0000313/EMBL:CCA72142.1} [Serendipita indica DSM 11827]|uniref:Related to triacylglycerol lipase 2 n=1 Tax=Serendipita indica (strain DSM 11827) TaxID=1109443 RepID=G4TLE9_SERID|nr:SubName: Full=Related to triacylglycerol lipase 2 {ECO:0000313/EMBL:CCA72142.1} [Serendipita indica DSM 11827]CCA72142.1 related to triacylglycerol lipase 2 [Serendipita indica DSM 11827]